METLNVKCPWCSSILKIGVTPGMDGKSLTCPVCKRQNLFKDFKVYDPSSQQPASEAADGDTKIYMGPQQGAGAPKAENLLVGRIVIIPTGRAFQLKHGKNVIGRKASASSAQFQIPTGDNKRMSREHLVIEVKRSPAAGILHLVSLFKQKVNKTFINSKELLWGDIIILQDGDIIKLPDLELKFEIPDDDRTVI